MQIKGKVHELFPEQQVTDTFKKQEIVIEIADNPQYPEYVKFEALNDRTSLISDLTAGDSVEIDFNLKGKPWTNKEGKKQYFNQLVIWRVKCVSQAYEAVSAEPKYQPPVNISSAPEEDDLPF